MRRGASVLVATLVVAGLAGIFVAGGGAGSRAAATTRVTVVATDFRFTLSKRSVPAGAVIFTVTNKGKVSHDFKIAGKKTPLLAPGRSATLRVMFSKTGRYPYLSTVSGQAPHGMKGVFSVVAAVAPTPATTPPYVAPAGPVGTADTTVTVGLFGGEQFLPTWIALSQTTIPSGRVTFVITNNCTVRCSFDLEGVKAGSILTERGQSETWTVALAPGVYRYHSDPNPSGMKGSFTVTP